jgi:hippurate hydrolase
VDAIIGLHNHVTADEAYLPGDILVTEDSATANIFAYEAHFPGTGGHVCHSRQLPNPVHMACSAVAQIASLPEPGPETVNAVTVVTGGSRNNIVPTDCTLAGSVRAFDPTLQQEMRRQVLQILRENGADRIDTTIDVMGIRIDHELLSRFRTVVSLLDPERGCRALKKRDMIGEDFARYADRIPGLYVFLHDPPEGEHYPLHHPKFDINEAVLPKGAALFAAFALGWQTSA